jgi:DNA phosphorothioation-associated putative methyltransferase
VAIAKAAARAATTSGIGKRVGSAIYVHRDALPLLGDEAEIVGKAESLAPPCDWNVAKIEKTSVSLLAYESFDTDFPALLTSAKVDIASGAVVETDYRKRANPPILHRKELLLPPDDPRLPKFRALTSTAEEYGLFEEPNKIGTRGAWNTKIAAAGLVLRGGRLLKEGEEHHVVARHRTAIARRDLSQPMQLMMRLGVVKPDRSVLDYGCGQGEDVEALASQGFEAFGWDPHHAAKGPRRPADVVNLGFVLNVIEDPRERAETLKAAWGFAGRALCVSVMAQSKAQTGGQKPHGDGFLTSWGTFQRYYTQQDLRDYVTKITGHQTLSLAPGIVAVFKDKDLEQEVLLRRRSRILVADALPRPPRRERIAVARPELRERLAPMLDSLRDISLSLGRMPEATEIPTDLGAALTASRIPWSRTLEALQEDLAADEAFAATAQARREDLLVHLALMQFPGSPKYRSLPKSIQTDIRSFFGSHPAAQEEGRRLLFSTGDRPGVRADGESAVAAGLAGMRGERNIRFRSSTLPRLPPRLRVLVGCAEFLQGGVDACDFVEINLEAPRVKMLTCDEVEKTIPFVVERIRVDLGRLKVSFDRPEPETSPIYFKSRYLPLGDPEREAQASVEAAMLATGLFPPDGLEPRWQDLRMVLTGIIPDL